LDVEGGWRGLFAERTAFEGAFARLLWEAPQRHGRVLDIGCGDNLPAALACLRGQFGTLDGVDPDPAIARHPLLKQRWQAPLEASGVPDEAYAMAYAYNVVEHLPDPRPFLKKVHALLEPGGVFYALAPNAVHPFAVLSRSIEVVGLKEFARKRIGLAETGEMRVNDYPAYYRCNSPSAVRRAIRGIGFREVTFYFHPCVQWDNYFPRCLRWAPHTYDYVLGSRLTSLMQVFMFRLQK
jgi:SAM-dependent methyltransferase